MHRRLAFVLLLLGLLTFGLVSPGQSAHASPLADPLDCGSGSLYQETIPGGVFEGDWSYDMRAGGGTWGQLTASEGNPPGAIGDLSTVAAIEIVFPVPVTIYNVRYDDLTTDSGTGFIEAWADGRTDVGTQIYVNSYIENGHGWETGDFDFGGTPRENVTALDFGRVSASGTTYLDNIYVCYSDGTSPGLTRPLTSADEDPTYGTIDLNEYTGDVDQFIFSVLGLSDTLNTVEAFSQNGYANVYAAEDGTITGLYRLTTCGTLFACNIIVPGGAPDHWFLAQLHDANDLWLVTVDPSPGDAGGQVLQYVVRDADQFLNWNMEISAGCILGKTIALDRVPGDFISPSVDQQVAAVSLVNKSDSSQSELLSQLTEYPDFGVACNADPRYAACLGMNAQFLRSGDGWLSSGGVTFGSIAGGGAQIPPGGEVYQNVILDPETSYALSTSVASSLEGTGVKLWLGSTYNGFLVNPPDYRDIGLPSAMPEGSIGSNGTLFEIGIQNLGDGNIKIPYLCLTADAPVTTPTTCYFQDPGFDYGMTYWDGDGTGDAGYVLLGDMQTVSQSVHLLPGDYRVKAKMSIDYSGFTAPETGDVKLLYEYPAESGFTEIGTVSVTDRYLTMLDFQQDFTVSVATDDTMTFRAEIQSGADEAVLGLQITQLCIEPQEGTVFPPGGGGGPPPFNSDCQIVIRPAVDAPVQLWIDYLWNQLNRFFTCHLMVLLNDMWGSMRYFFTTVGWAIRSSFAYGAIYNQWLGTQLIPYMNGQFANIAYGRTTTITESGDGSCHDLFCVLDSLITGALNPLVGAVTRIVDFVLWLLTQAAGTLLTLVVALFGLFFTIITTILHFFQLMIGYLQSIVLGFNLATPTPLPGIPQCQLDPQGNAVCIGLWMLENTVFADEGQLYIPLLIGAMSIALIFWAVDNFRKKLGDIGDKL